MLLPSPKIVVIHSVIPRPEIEAVEEFLAGIDTPGLQLLCAVCQADFPESDPAGGWTRYGKCPATGGTNCWLATAAASWRPNSALENPAQLAKDDHQNE